jgi:glycosyltransferase involved in cell wall biosynthesis
VAPVGRVLVDGTPLLGARTGVGRYVAGLLAGLGELAGAGELGEVRVTAFTARGQRALRAAVPNGVRAVGWPVPARVLRAAWRRLPVPPVELLAGRADVLHATNFVLPPALRAAGVLTVHDLAFLRRPRELPPGSGDLPALVRRGARRAAAVCVPTRAVAGQVMELLGVPPGRVHVTPLGVDPAWGRAAVPDGAALGRLGVPGEYVLFVGTPQPRKGLDVLLAAHGAARRAPGLVLVGGGGWGAAGAGAGAGGVGWGGRVVRLGWLTDGAVRGLVAGAAAVVLPSRDEGFGLPVLEAFACGVPVICTDVPALVEVAGGLASHVPVGSVDALAHALDTVADLPRDPATAAARRARAATFTWQRCARATLTAYRAATSSSSP